jgi:hypothetical protein
MSNTEHRFADPNRHVVEVPDSFAIARWPRDADVPTIARCILGTLKYEPHAADTTALRRALEGVIEHEQQSKENGNESYIDPNHENSQMTKEQWLAVRKEAALKIDPETAEVLWDYALTLDPYGIGGVPEEYQQVGREYFARSPGSDIWVWFGDLPDTTRDALWEKHKSRLAFPAGLIPFELFPEEIDELFAED